MNDLIISIVIPVYNGGKFISDTINSIRNQSYKNFQLIIIDGGSKDNTAEIVYQNIDIVSHFISEPDNGMYDALNKGCKLATGDIMCYINSDDRLKLDCLELVNKKFQDKKIDFVFGNVDYISENGDKLYTYLAYNMSATAIKFMKRLPFAQQSAFWRREIYSIAGGFDSTLKYVADSKFFISIYLNKNIKRAHINKSLGEFRMHEESFSIGSEKAMKAECLRVINENKLFKNNNLVRMYFEFLNKMWNIRGIRKKLKYNGIKLK